LKKKIAYFLSHPIQYQSPMVKLLSQQNEIDLTVYYFTDHTLGGKDTQFGRKINWDIPILDGYQYQFIRNWALKPAVSGAFWGLINPGLLIVLLRNRPDYIVIHGWAYLSNLLLLVAAKILRIKVIMRAESPWKQEKISRSKRIVLKFFVDKALYLGVQNKLFYQNYQLKDSQLFFMPYCVDNKRFTKAYDRLSPERNRLKYEFGYTDQDVVLLFCGKYIEKKRPFDLLKALKNAANVNIKCIMVGEGELRKEMEQFIIDNDIQDQVNLTGFINQSEIARYYVVADIFVLPSGRGETWGLVINEAENFHLPIIASDMVGCTDDLIKEGINGYTYPCGDIDALSAKLKLLINDESRRKQMGEASAQIVGEYSYENCVKGIMEALA
jgi:glycosyltransferase involved in cell wall biosynthesis